MHYYLIVFIFYTDHSCTGLNVHFATMLGALYDSVCSKTFYLECVYSKT